MSWVSGPFLNPPPNPTSLWKEKKKKLSSEANFPSICSRQEQEKDGRLHASSVNSAGNTEEGGRRAHIPPSLIPLR